MEVRQCFWGDGLIAGAVVQCAREIYRGYADEETNEGTNENANHRSNEETDNGGSAVSYPGGYGSVIAYRVQRAGKDSV